MDFITYTTIGAFSLGFIAGISTSVIIKHEKVSLEKAIALTITFVWLGLHIWGFVRNQEVSWIFDVVGAMAVGGLIGINAIDVIRNLSFAKNGK